MSFISSSCISLLVDGQSCSSYLGGFVRQETGGYTAAILWGTASRICSKQHLTFFCSSDLNFSLSVLIVLLYGCTIWTLSHSLKEIRSYFIRDQIFHMIISLSITVHAFPKHILILLSVDEILLPSYMNWSTNFRGLPFKVGDGFYFV